MAAAWRSLELQEPDPAAIRRVVGLTLETAIGIRRWLIGRELFEETVSLPLISSSAEMLVFRFDAP
jgi:hypothetical protein